MCVCEEKIPIIFYIIYYVIRILFSWTWKWQQWSWIEQNQDLYLGCHMLNLLIVEKSAGRQVCINWFPIMKTPKCNIIYKRQRSQGTLHYSAIPGAPTHLVTTALSFRLERFWPKHHNSDKKARSPKLERNRGSWKVQQREPDSTLMALISKVCRMQRNAVYRSPRYFQVRLISCQLAVHVGGVPVWPGRNLRNHSG